MTFSHGGNCVSKRFERCPNCLREAPMVEVHGHVQCVLCGVNVSPCCDGAVGEEVELQWLKHGEPMPEGYVLAQSNDNLMHHNHYAVLIRKVG